MCTRLVYTIVLNGYDSIKPIKNNNFADYICVTNATNLIDGQSFRGWTIKKLGKKEIPEKTQDKTQVEKKEEKMKEEIKSKRR
jgi:hypothetical protein